MAINYKILGQLHPAAATPVILYTVPTATQTVISTITIANVTAVTGKARVYVRKAGNPVAHLSAIAYDVPIVGNSLLTLTLGITMEASDLISVQSANGADLTFHAYGSEIV